MITIRNFEAILQHNLAQIAENLEVVLRIESSYEHALRLVDELRYVVEALLTLRKLQRGWVLPLRRSRG